MPFVAVTAAAWACNPQAHLLLDRDVYEAGSTITATGAYFPGNATITVSAPTGSTTVQTSPGGGFSIQLRAPMTPGNYTIAATRPTGGFAPASFTVIAAAPTPPAPDPAPEQGPTAVLPAPELAPDVAAPTILRPKLANEIVHLSRTNTVELFCGRFVTAPVSGTCGAVSTRRRSAGAPWLELRPKAFRAHIGRPVLVRFRLHPRLVRRVRAARQLRMRATIVAEGELGGQTTKTFTFTLKPPKTPTKPRYAP